MCFNHKFLERCATVTVVVTSCVSCVASGYNLVKIEEQQNCN